MARVFAMAVVLTACVYHTPRQDTIDGSNMDPDAPGPVVDAPIVVVIDGTPGTPDAPPPPPPDAFSCPSGYALRAPGSCHRYVMTPMNWQAAETDCEVAAAHLAVIDDATEDGALPSNVWIGYTELITAGAFRWVNGLVPGYTLGWASGQPATGGAACVEARADGWHDDNCPEPKFYVCEYDGIPADPATF